MKIKIKNVRGYFPDQIITIQTDSAGIPLEQFWRKRLKDACVDNCIEVITTSESKKGKSK
jgi:hypothetical protein